MKERKKVWISSDAYKRAKIAAAESESNLIDYFDKIVTGKEPKKDRKRRGYNYGFLK